VCCNDDDDLRPSSGSLQEENGSTTWQPQRAQTPRYKTPPFCRPGGVWAWLWLKECLCVQCVTYLLLGFQTHQVQVGVSGLELGHVDFSRPVPACWLLSQRVINSCVWGAAAEQKDTSGFSTPREPSHVNRWSYSASSVKKTLTLKLDIYPSYVCQSFLTHAHSLFTRCHRLAPSIMTPVT